MLEEEKMNSLMGKVKNKPEAVCTQRWNSPLWVYKEESEKEIGRRVKEKKNLSLCLRKQRKESFDKGVQMLLSVWNQGVIKDFTLSDSPFSSHEEPLPSELIVRVYLKLTYLLRESQKGAQSEDILRSWILKPIVFRVSPLIMGLFLI